MKIKTVCFILFISSFSHFTCAKEWSFNLPYYLLLGGIEKSVDQPFRKFVTDYGYPVEVHPDVKTEDGYLLTLFRIPYGIKNNNSDVKEKPVAFLFHGLFLSGEDWVALGPEKSLAFILADAGYDVWLGNARGNMHSRKHVKYNPTWNGKFWDFSLHEIGYYDLKAKIDYILTTTKQEQMYYLAHSQGGTTFFILNSLRPEYNKRFKLMVAFAPAILLPNCKGLAFRALAISNTVDHIIYGLGYKEAMPHLKLYSLLGNTVCKVKGLPQYLCKKIHFSLIGGISDHFDEELMPKIMQHDYAGSSFKQSIHFAQWIKHNRFRQYDHGKIKNLKIYGSKTPPDYNLTNVVAPVAYYYGKHDILVPPKDQKASIRLLPNVVDDYLYPYSGFTHMDTYFGNDAAPQAYERALKLMQQY